MKGFLRSIAINLLTLYLTSLIFIGFSIRLNLATLLTGAVMLALINKIVKPLIKLLLLPINLVTLGLFRWAVSVITLIILEALVDGISIHSFYFAGLEYNGFVVPAFTVSLIASYILTSIILRAISSAIRWLISD